MGEDVTETLEVVSRQWKVIQTVREKFICRILREDRPAAGPRSCHHSGVSWG
jgi:transposase